MQCSNENLKEAVIRLIDEWTDKKYYGSIQLNFNAGSVPNINVNRSIRMPEANQNKGG
jgi:hypothetical protein